MIKYKLVDFQQGETNCQHCGTAIKNIYTIEEVETGIQLHVGSECVKTLLQVESLPKEYKQIEKEYKNKKFNESIVDMLLKLNSHSKNFENTRLIEILKQGKQKATDKTFLNDFLLKREYYGYYEEGDKTYNIGLTHIVYYEETRNGMHYNLERIKTTEEAEEELKAVKNNNKARFLSDFANTKECKKFIDELIKYAENNYKMWGWTVKFTANR